MKRRTFERYQR